MGDMGIALHNPHSEHMGRKERTDIEVLVVVDMYRELSGEAVSQTFDEMMAEVKENPNLQGHFGTVARTTWNRKDNEFPQWAREVLEKAGFEFQSFNLYYCRKVKSAAAGRKLMEWWTDEITPWAQAKKLPMVNRMMIQTMDATEDLANMESY
jgi:hypothetical protein